MNHGRIREWLPVLAAVMAALGASATVNAQAVSNRLFSENFEGLALGPNRE
jgi:hypothetical protein